MNAGIFFTCDNCKKKVTHSISLIDVPDKPDMYVCEECFNTITKGLGWIIKNTEPIETK